MGAWLGDRLNEQIWLVVVCVALIGVGLLAIFAKDLMWSWTDYSNRAEGVRSERTMEWEGWTTAGGVLAIVVGIVMILVVFSAQASGNAEKQQAALDCPEGTSELVCTSLAECRRNSPDDVCDQMRELYRRMGS
jgi:hypothetical protein